MDLRSLFMQQQGGPAGPPADQPPDPLAAPPPYNLYGYGPEAPPEAPPPPGMVERGLNATGDAANAVGGASAEVVNKALKAAEDAFNSVLQGAGEQGGKAADAATNWWDQMNQGVQQFGRDFSEGFNTGQMNKSLGAAGLAPVPPRDREDPYYGQEYPSLTRPQPGQDWEPPGQGPQRGEEVGWPYYMSQAPRPRAQIPGRKPVQRRSI